MTSSRINARQWQQGAVKRLVGVYEGIVQANARNAQLMKDVSNALKESALSLRRRTSSHGSKWSRRSSSANSPSPGTVPGSRTEYTRPSVMIPTPAKHVSSPKIRRPVATSSKRDQAPGGIAADTHPANEMEVPCVLPSLVSPSSPKLIPASDLLPPTPPDTPPKANIPMAQNFSILASPFETSTSLQASENKKVTPNERDSIRCSPTKSSVSPSEQVNESITSPTGHKATGIPQLDSAIAFSSSTRSLDLESPVPMAKASCLDYAIPKIKLRDYDGAGIGSREVSFSSIVSGPSDSVSPQQGIGTDIRDEADLNAYLSPLRENALLALEDDTATLVDALRSFVNELRKLSREHEATKSPSRSGSASAKNKNAQQICLAARKELAQMKSLISELKEPRMEMLVIAKQGPSTQTIPEAEKWGNLTRMQKVQILRRALGGKSDSIFKSNSEYAPTKDLYKVLTAVVEEEASKEFLDKVRGWEDGVESLERSFGLLFV